MATRQRLKFSLLANAHSPQIIRTLHSKYNRIRVRSTTGGTTRTQHFSFSKFLESICLGLKRLDPRDERLNWQVDSSTKETEREKKKV